MSHTTFNGCSEKDLLTKHNEELLAKVAELCKDKQDLANEVSRLQSELEQARLDNQELLRQNRSLVEQVNETGVKLQVAEKDSAYLLSQILNECLVSREKVNRIFNSQAESYTRTYQMLDVYGDSIALIMSCLQKRNVSRYTDDGKELGKE